MPVIESLLARAGYVKLSRYGMALTPDGRIVDLNAAVPPAMQPMFAPGPTVAPPPAPMFTVPATAPAAVTTRPATPPPPPAQMRVSRAMPSVIISNDVIPHDGDDDRADDDEWEWQAALARARHAAPAAPTPPPVRTAAPAPRAIPGATVARRAPAAPIKPPPIKIPAIPVRAKTAPVVAAPLPLPPPPVFSQPVFSQPIAPAMPRLPVTPLPPPAPRRFARGTGPQLPATRPVERPAAQLAPALSIGDDTSEITNDVTDLAIGEVTSVDIARPSAPIIRPPAIRPPAMMRPPGVPHTAPLRTAPAPLPRLSARS